MANPSISFRKLTVALGPVGILFIIIVSVRGYAVIAASAAPLVYSALLYGFFAYLERRSDKKKPIGLLGLAALDILGSLMYLGALLPVWVGSVRATMVLSYHWYYSGEEVKQGAMLVAYATSVFIVNMYAWT
jgi:hypothetical protein